MKVNIVAIGQRPPQWVTHAYETYAKRFGPNMPIALHQISTPARTKNSNIPQLVKQEGEKMLKTIPPHAYTIALDETGKSFTTNKFAKALESLRHEYQQCYFLIGGPDGLAQPCLDNANAVWSLSELTLPHNLARVLLVEQLYRAYTIMNKLPYHREGKAHE